MIEDPVAEWRELSALYEQADLLSGVAMRDWIARLPDDLRPLVPRLERMLAARDRAAAEQFLEALPRLADEAEQQPRDWEAGRRIGPYRLVRHAGSGGMAEVWLAERDDGAFARTVAVKLLRTHPTRAERDNFVERFRRERDILASLDHPNIAGLHDAGVTAEGQPWLALEFVEGEAITVWCDRHRLPIAARVRLFLQVLLAVEHAHSHLAIHRDLKPSNILVTEPGVARLLDFGIAKLLDAGTGLGDLTDLTAEGGRPMTPRYASPEQLRGSTLTTAVDVYALGLVAHELLCGQLPYDLGGKSLGEAESIILTSEPEPLSRQTPNAVALAARNSTLAEYRALLRPDLDAIVLHCLQKSPAERYPSVEALRLDLQRWLDHEPVQVVLPRAWYRLEKFVRRHRRGVATSAAVLAIMFALVGLTIWQLAVNHRESALARAARDFVLDALRDADPESSKDAGAAAGPLLDLSVTRARRLLADQPELQAEVLERIAEVDQDLDRYASAQPVLEQALAIRRLLGQKEKTAETEIELAFNLRRIGDDVRAAQVLAAVDVGKSLALQGQRREVEGWLAWDSGEAERAKELWLDALALSQREFGRDDIRLAVILQGLVGADMSLRDYPSAERNADEEVRITTRADKITMTRRIAALADRAEVTFASGDYARALPATHATLDACVKSLGTAAEACFVMRQQLAFMLLRVGANAEAMTLLPALDAEAANPLSPSRQIQAQSIALRVAAANSVADNRASALANNLKPSMTLKLLMTGRLALAEAAVRGGDPVAAIRELDLMSVQPYDVPADYAARALMIRGLAQQEQGRTADALGTLEHAAAAYAERYGPGHTQTLLCELNVGAILVADGHVADGRRRLERDAALLRNRLPADAPLFDILSKLGGFTRVDSPASRSNKVPFFN